MESIARLPATSHTNWLVNWVESVADVLRIARHGSGTTCTCPFYYMLCAWTSQGGSGRHEEGRRGYSPQPLLG